VHIPEIKRLIPVYRPLNELSLCANIWRESQVRRFLMKKNIFILILSIIAVASCVIYVPVDERRPPSREGYYDEPYTTDMDTSYFYDYLSPYGVWVNHSPHGYVWVPERMAYGWRPYTEGQWVWSDFGWTWASRFRWGWIPFHYGRWGWDRYIGWFWVPGTEWGPAWVSWRSSNLYIGWAPIPPDARFIPGVGITTLPYTLGPSSWVFVEYPYFLDHRLYRYVLPMERNLTIINYSTLKTDIRVRDNRIINWGVDVDYIRRRTKQTISRYELAPADRPGQSRVENGRVEIYNPVIRRNETAHPDRVLQEDEVVDRINRTAIAEPDRPSGSQEIRLKDAQEQEIKQLENSQEKELQQVLRQKQEEERAAKDAAEKQNIKKEYEQKVIKIKQSHEKEKAEIKKRHKQEEEKTKKKVIKKKEIKK
jgi:hypothetical protein